MSKFHNETPSVAKMIPEQYIPKGNNDAKDTKTTESSTPKKKTSYAEAYKKRDMKTYGDLSLDEYTAEAKRQNKSKKETGKWDAPKKPMKGKTKEEAKVEKTEVKEKEVTTENNASEDKPKSELIKEKNTKKVDEINKKGDERVKRIKERKARREARKQGRQDRREARRNRREKVRNARKGVETKEETVATYKKK